MQESISQRSFRFVFRSVVIALVCPAVVISLDSDAMAARQAAQPQAGQSQVQATNQLDSAADAAGLEKAKASLIEALGTMVPGGIEENTPRAQRFHAVIELFRQGKVRESLEELKRMEAADPNLPPADLMMAGLSFAVGDAKSGVAILEKSSVTHGGNPSVFLSFGQLALNEGRVTDAQAHAEKCASLISGGKYSPEQLAFFQTKYYELVVGIQLRRSQYDQASASLERLNSVAPNLPAYYLAKAELLFHQTKDYEAVLDNLEKFSEETSQKKKPILTLIEWFLKSNDQEMASKWMETAVRQNPADGNVQLAAAHMAMSKEDFQSALISIRNYEKAMGETFGTKDMKGRIAFAKQSYEIAEAHFQVLNEKDPKNINYANVYALCLAESNNAEKQAKAKTISLRVTRAMPDSALALATLGYIHLKLGEVEDAKALLGRAAQTKTVTPEISYFIAQLLQQTGESAKAEQILSQSVASKGLFLYRAAAVQLRSQIQKNSGGLPAREN